MEKEEEFQKWLNDNWTPVRWSDTKQETGKYVHKSNDVKVEDFTIDELRVMHKNNYKPVIIHPTWEEMRKEVEFLKAEKETSQTFQLESKKNRKEQLRVLQYELSNLKEQNEELKKESDEADELAKRILDGKGRIYIASLQSEITLLKQQLEGKDGEIKRLQNIITDVGHIY